MTLGLSSSTNLLNFPRVTREKRQRSLSLDDVYLARYVSPWARNPNANANTWRWWVFNEPISMICRETLIANLLSLDWKIDARKSDQRDELRGVIRHYTRLLERGGEYYGFDWTGLVEWIGADLLDLPFGSGSELGRKGDLPNGRVMWLKPLDGGTLYPVSNKNYPVIQMHSTYEIVTFPAHAIARTYMSPRPEIMLEGWGLAPPEKAYFALNMLYRGDKYYADLLEDSPPAGILDLMDVEWDDALKWVESLRDFYMGMPSAMKIPVLAEHLQKAEFIPFGKNPNELMYDKITLKYAAIVAAAYGMTLSDIGLQATSASGQTLAGEIRNERKTKRTGFARAKKKLKYWVEGFLPDVLEFNFVDLDDELNVALGRARLATITALGAAQDKGVISSKEHRLILLGDGLFGNVALPEEPPADAKEAKPTNAFGKTTERPGMLGRPEAASTGGQGEVRKFVIFEKSKNFETHLNKFVSDMTKDISQTIEKMKEGVSDDELYLVRSAVDNSIFGGDDTLGLLESIKSKWEGKRWFKVVPDKLSTALEELAIERMTEIVKERYVDGELDNLEDVVGEYKDKIHGVDWERVAGEFAPILDETTKTFIGKSTTFILKDLLLSEDGFDTEYLEGDNNIVDKVYQAISDNFDEFAYASIGMSTEDLIENIVQEIMK